MTSNDKNEAMEGGVPPRDVTASEELDPTIEALKKLTLYYITEFSGQQKNWNPFLNVIIPLKVQSKIGVSGEGDHHDF